MTGTVGTLICGVISSTPQVKSHFGGDACPSELVGWTQSAGECQDGACGASDVESVRIRSQMHLTIYAGQEQEKNVIFHHFYP